ncbi:hypothetical protein FA13DRAFT_1726264 [Coprinellus micaceus]|uniref:Uncharacterized protein n=1 Tax=Coprinellus micaceus TaxID=71717 RepID=A0A4Y7TTC0_COPMI|nr:hypothetical protein FA13DRAFT_1726264 [Coprinellus micaceus]
MTDFKAAQKTLDAEIEQLDVDIAQCRSRIDFLESTKLELKSRRNALAPIGRLPPELIVKIFSSSLGLLSSSQLSEFRDYKPRARFVVEDDVQEARAKDAIYRRLLRPDVLTLSHVSHGWRSLSFETRDLWSRIQVQLRTSPELLKLMWRNAGEGMIELGITGMLDDRSDNKFHSFPVFNLVYALLQIGSSKLRSIGIYCRASSFLNALHGRAESLESLTIKGDELYRDPEEEEVVYDTIFEGGTPNLRRLEISSLAIPWTSSLLLSSPHLTQVALGLTPRPSPDSFAAFFAFLRHSPRLTTLAVDLGAPEGDEESDYYLSLVSNRTPIQLHGLKALRLDSVLQGPIDAILNLLRVPSDISSLTLTASEGSPGLAETVLAVHTSMCGPNGNIAPEEMDLGYTQARCWREQRFEWYMEDRDHPRKRLKLADKPTWMYLQVTMPFERHLEQTVYRLPWSLTKLRSISIHRPEVPATFWAALADLATLEVVRIETRNSEPFLQALAGDSDAITPIIGAVHTPPAPLPSLDDITRERVQRNTFPALSAVWFTQLSHGLSGPGPGSPIPPDAAAAFVIKIVAAFNKRARPTLLEEIKFLNCDRSTLAEAALNILSSVTRCVVWDRVAFILQRLPND